MEQEELKCWDEGSVRVYFVNERFTLLFSRKEIDEACAEMGPAVVAIGLD